MTNPNLVDMLSYLYFIEGVIGIKNKKSFKLYIGKSMHDAYELISVNNNTGKAKLVKEVKLDKLDKLRKVKNKKANKLRKKGVNVYNDSKIY